MRINDGQGPDTDIDSQDGNESFTVKEIRTVKMGLKTSFLVIWFIRPWSRLHTWFGWGVGGAVDPVIP